MSEGKDRVIYNKCSNPFDLPNHAFKKKRTLRRISRDLLIKLNLKESFSVQICDSFHKKSIRKSQLPDRSGEIICEAGSSCDISKRESNESADRESDYPSSSSSSSMDTTLEITNIEELNKSLMSIESPIKKRKLQRKRYPREKFQKVKGSLASKVFHVEDASSSLQNYNGWGAHRANHTIPPFWLDDRPPLLRTEEELLSGLTTVDDTTRHQLIQSIPTTGQGETCIGCGVRLALQNARNKIAQADFGIDFARKRKEGKTKENLDGRYKKWNEGERLGRTGLGGKRRMEEEDKKRLRWAGHVACMGESRNAYRVLVGRPEGKRPLGRPRRRWEDNIKMDLREVGYDGRDWINLAQDRDQWRAYVRAAMNLRVLSGMNGVIVLVTDGQNTEPSQFISDIEDEVVSAGSKVVAVGFGGLRTHLARKKVRGNGNSSFSRSCSAVRSNGKRTMVTARSGESKGSIERQISPEDSERHANRRLRNM
ncbi:hypothetical protein ANN_14166 [Periplaneta americana]|uniref:VWFA domain-containing protein n=1 Tax=Periplaneta americana TaxID=6978 RepID=A0ABQ8SX33_PERAM|nr:hypothetical protein ANN_14166 [Periplaneta americana]